MTEPLTLQTRTVYRALLRELPRRHLSTPSPLHQRLRQLFRAETTTPSTPSPLPQSTSIPTQSAQAEPTSTLPFSTPSTIEERALRIQEAEQLAQYARAQRAYAALLERYNPGMDMDEEERVRLTARRVGFDLPVVKGTQE
ncbi:hypothetical protein N7474_009010 [Penicillium riverlandense]|uniref:uncharacterized protein n=1 Tax=Penicillium riverlandense TaxID=1903569 RepID=UPI002549A882|nr:uncharacterized protein N7474_009010 [Penicillium riverlandense]KAJ5807741.1 hypothetical protein N7474_009010 [Penicillium riverlandense]